MIAVSFLGKGNYTKTEYSYKGKSFKTEYFPEAIFNIFEPDETYIILTPEAYEKHYNNLSKRIKFNEISIKVGKDEDEMWDMFNSVVNAIQENSEIIFDITHGFRSQPLFALAIIIFLKTVKNIRVNKILYGAKEAETDNITPIFDLSVVLNIVEWSFAVNDFIKFGNAKYLSSILSEIQNTHNKIGEDKITGVKNFGKHIDDLSEKLSFLRLNTTKENNLAKTIELLSESIIKINRDFNKEKSLEPLKSLFSLIKEKVEPFSALTDNIFDIESLKAQVKIVEWYINSSQYQQAFTLYREFLITLFCLKAGFNPISDRVLAEKNINELKIKYDFENSSVGGKNLNDVHYKLVKYFNDIIEVRNDLNHASMRAKPIPIKTFKDKSQKLIVEMKDILKEYLNISC